MKPLTNKVALITGAAGAIGYGICEVLLENGCTLAVTDLPGERLEAFAADLNALVPGKSHPIALDVTSID